MLHTGGNTQYAQAKTEEGDEAERLCEAAGGEYEAAWAVAPGQSSVIALIRTHAALGNDDRVQSLVNGIPATAGSDGHDPWHSYNACFTGGELVEGLRREAQR